MSLLEYATARSGLTPQRAGDLAVNDAASAADGSWRCWISGRLTNAADLQRRFGLPPAADDTAIVARAFAREGKSACGILRGTYILVAHDRDRDRWGEPRESAAERPAETERAAAAVEA